MKKQIIVTLLLGAILVSGCGSVESRQNRESAASRIYSEIQTTERTEAAEKTEQSGAADAQEKRAYKSGSIYETIQEGEVNIIYSLTEEGGVPLAVDGSYSRYYVPAAAYREELRTLADELECSEKTVQEATAEWWDNFHYEYLGVLINYRGFNWELYSEGKLLNMEDGLYLETNQPLCDMVLSILEEDLDIVPYNPKALNNIESATLLIRDSGTGEELCRKEVTDEYNHQKYFMVLLS